MTRALADGMTYAVCARVSGAGAGDDRPSRTPPAVFDRCRAVLAISTSDVCRFIPWIAGSVPADLERGIVLPSVIIITARSNEPRHTSHRQ